LCTVGVVVDVRVDVRGVEFVVSVVVDVRVDVRGVECLVDVRGVECLVVDVVDLHGSFVGNCDGAHHGCLVLRFGAGGEWLLLVGVRGSGDVGVHGGFGGYSVMVDGCQSSN
jgi:hypothetical protein